MEFIRTIIDRRGDMIIRSFAPKDAEAVAELVAVTLRRVNSRDYPPAYIEHHIRLLQPEHILERAGWTHFYVACDAGRIVGCGAIGPYWGKEDESSLFTVFVHPDYQRRGLGRRIMEALERDPYFLRARRIEIPASITGTPFYKHMGYTYKNGVKTPDDEGLLRLEKYRNLEETP